MLDIEYKENFLKTIRKIKELAFKERIKKRVEDIINNPEIGKPMRFARKGTREVYVGSYRLAYAYIKEENTILFIDIYHKDEQ